MGVGSQEEDQNEVVVIPVCGTQKTAAQPQGKAGTKEVFRREGNRRPLSKSCSKRRLQNPQEKKATSLKSGHHQASVSGIKG